MAVDLGRGGGTGTRDLFAPGPSQLLGWRYLGAAELRLTARCRPASYMGSTHRCYSRGALDAHSWHGVREELRAGDSHAALAALGNLRKNARLTRAGGLGDTNSGPVSFGHDLLIRGPGRLVHGFLPMEVTSGAVP